MGLWELMASGGLPALAKLKVTLFEPEEGDEEVRSRVAPALEAVAGTLTQLRFEWLSQQLDVGYELGVAVGKLRRLKDLTLDLSCDGRVYHAFAQGMAAGGGDRPLPSLWRVWVVEPVRANADLLASLLLPSVRVLVTPLFFHDDPAADRAALLTACALRREGYKHTWAVECAPEVEDLARAIAPQCRRGHMLGDDIMG
jgi:hypothetical protein